MIHTIKSRLRGAIEFMLFMPGAEKYFRKTSFQQMLKSFLIPLILIPYGIWGMSLIHGTELPELSKLDGINQLSFPVFVAITVSKALLLTAFFITLTYYVVGWMDRKEFFYDFIAAGNWVLIPSMIPSLIITIMIIFGGQDWMGVYMVATINILYGIAVSAFMICRLLNLPWELSGAFAIFSLFIGEAANKVVHLIGVNYFS